jgi:hypothetical protein
MSKSNINEPSAGTEYDSNSTAQDQQVSQPNANTNVVGSLIEMSELKNAKRFIIKYGFIDDPDDEKTTITLIGAAKLCAAYSHGKDAEIERVRKQRNDFEKEIDK